MADKDFVVKNGLVVNTSVLVANGTKVGVNTASPDAALTVAGTANLQGNVTFSGTFVNSSANVELHGNVHIMNNAYVDKKLYVGNTQTMVQDLPTIIQAVDNFNGFVMVSSQNLSQLDDACADLLIYADNTNGLSNFNDLGINNSRFDGRIHRIVTNSTAGAWQLGETVYQRNGAGANIAVGQIRDITTVNSSAVSLKIRVSEDDGLETYVGMSNFTNTAGSNLSLRAVTSAANADVLAAVAFFSPEANSISRRNYAFTVGKRGDGYLYNANSALTIGTTAGGIRSTTLTIPTSFSSGVNTITINSGNSAQDIALANTVTIDMDVTGTGIATGTYVTSMVNSTAFRISKNTTGTSGASITLRDEYYDLNEANNPIIFHVGGMMAKNEIARFGGNGNFTVGGPSSSRDAKLNVNGTANIAGQTNVGANVNVTGNINATANVYAPRGIFSTNVVVGAASINSTAFLVGNATQNASAFAVSGNSIVSTATMQSGNLVIGNGTVTDTALIRVQNSSFSANMTPGVFSAGISTVNTTVMSVGANVFANATTVSVGNTTVNALISQNTTAVIQVTGNVTVSANLTTGNLMISNAVRGQANFAGNVAITGNANITGNVYAPSGVFSSSANVGIVAISTTAIDVGANVDVDSTGFKIVGTSSIPSTNIAGGNISLGNSSITGNPTVQVQNSTSTANVTPGTFAAGISTVNTTAVSIGANVIANSSALLVGNSTVNSVMNSSTLSVIVAAVSANLTTGNLAISNAVRGQANFAGNVAVAGNTNVTGNVYAPSGVFSTSANIGAVAISTTALGVGSNVSLDTTGLVVTGNASVPSMNLAGGNVTLGNSSVTGNPTVQVQNSTSIANLSPGTLVAGISTVNTTVISVGANVFANATTVSVGNSTINAILSQNATAALQVTGNATISANLTVGNLVISNSVRGQANFAGNVAITSGNLSISGNTSVTGNLYAPSGVFTTSVNVGTVALSTTGIAVGSNVTVETSGFKVAGNTLVASINAAGGNITLGNGSITGTPTLQVQNSTSIANVTPGTFVAGISTVNTTMISVGANVFANASAVSVGNSTVNVIMAQNTAAALRVTGNATVSANLTTGNLIVSGSVRGDTSFANNVSVGGNSSVTGNVYTNSGVFAVSVNVGTSVSISTTEIDVGANVVVDRAGLKITGNTLIPSMNVSGGMITLGNSTISNTPTVSLTNSTASSNLTPGGLTTGAIVINAQGSTINLGSNVSMNSSVISVGNNTINVVIDPTAYPDYILKVSANASIDGSLLVKGDAIVNGQMVFSDVVTVNGDFTPYSNLSFDLGNTTSTWRRSHIQYVNVPVNGNVTVGNASLNTVSSFNAVRVQNSTSYFANLSIDGLSVGNNSVNGQFTSTEVRVGNSTFNTAINSTAVVIGNASVNTTSNSSGFYGNVVAGSLSGNLTGNVIATTVNASANVRVGGNVTLSTSNLTIVNSTAILTQDASVLTMGNTSITTAPRIVVQNTAGATVINSNFVSTTSLSGNLAGNVVATTINASSINSTSMNATTVNATTVNATTLQIGTAFVATATGVSTANLTVQGNLIVTGTTISLNTATLDVKDLNITVAKGVASAAAATGAGITVDVANAEIVYNNAGNTWISNVGFAVGNSTSNVNINSTAFVGNTVGIHTGNVAAVNVVATSNVMVGANVLINTQALSISNTTVGSVQTAGSLTIGNNAVVASPQIVVQNSAGTTTIGSNNITTRTFSGNVVSTTTSATANITVGANVTIDTAKATFGAALGTNAPQVIIANTTGTTTINANFVSTTNLSGNLTGNVTATTITSTNGSFSGMITASNTAANSTTSAAVWLNGSAGALGFDSSMTKRISWNDGVGSFSIRAGNFSNGTVAVYQSDGTGTGGAAAITMTTDGATTNGTIVHQVARANGDGNSVTWATNTSLNTSTFAVGANLTVSGNSTLTGNTSFGGDITITGNLIVLGTTTSQNSASLSVTDLTIVVAKDAATPAAADGAGIRVDTANATLLYKNASNTWLSNVNITVGNSVSNVYANSTSFVGNTLGTHTGNVVGNVASTTMSATANISVGSNVLITTANVAIGNASANVYANSTAFVGNVVSTSVNATSVNATTVNATTLQTTNFSANATIVNATSYNIGTTVIANSTGVYATHLNGTAAASYYRAGSTDVALADGGTNASLTAAAGGVVFSNSTALSVTAVGTAGHVLVSAGSGTPVWTNPATLTAYNALYLDSVVASNYYRSGSTDVALTDGGTNASLTAAAGGVVFSNSSALSITGVGTAGYFLTSQGTGTPTWTNPASYVQNTDTRTLSGNLTFSGNSVFSGSNTVVNAVFRVINATANVFLAAANGNVGIGNATPTHKLRVEGTTSLVGDVTDVNSLTVGNSVVNTTAIKISNTSVVAVIDGSSVSVGNSSVVTAPQIVVQNTAGATTINSNYISTTSISGNLTGNVAATTISGNLSGNVAATTINASANVKVGANVLINLSAISISNTTHVLLQRADLVQVGNSSIIAAPQVVVQNTAGATTINSNYISTTSISGNLSGNVAAVTISATANVTTNTAYATNSFNVGTAFTANSTVVNAVSFKVGATTVANTTGTYATHFNGQQASFYLDASNMSSGFLPYARIPANVINTTADFTRTGVTTFSNTSNFNGNVVLGSALLPVGLMANGSFGTAGQVLHSNGTATYWATDDQGVTSVASGNGILGGTITDTGTLYVKAGTGVVVNTLGVHVNSTYIATIDANNTTYLNGQLASYYRNADNMNAGSLALARGGTAATNAADARLNLGLGNLATSNLFVDTVGPSGGQNGDIWLKV